MINLVPPHIKNTASKEYWGRMLTVWAFLMVGVFIALLALLVPSYILVKAQLEAIDMETSAVTEETEKFIGSENLVKEANMLAAQLMNRKKEIVFSDILEALNQSTNKGVVIDRFTVTQTSTEIGNTKVQGTADSRQSLADFRIALERHPFFETAVVPISDLARDEDLPFDITITMSAQAQE